MGINNINNQYKMIQIDYGWIANILVFLYKLPQMYTMIKAHDVTGLSVHSFIIQLLSYTLYIVHGFIIQDDALAYGMIIPLAQNIIIIVMYCYIVRKKNDET